MDVISWLVPQSLVNDPKKNTRHRGIAKSLLTISLVTLLMFVGMLLARGRLPAAEYALFAAAILTPIAGVLLIRVTNDITLGLVTTNIAGVVIIAVWAFLTGGILSFALPGFLANLALLSIFGNTAILLGIGAVMVAALLLLYAATVLGWLPASFAAAADVPGLMLTAMLGSVGIVILAGVLVARDRALVKARLLSAQHAAEQSSRAKTVFLASMGNEFRTPLNTLIELADKLHNDTAPPPSAGQLAAIDYIKAVGVHLLGMVTQVMDLSRIEAGGLKVDMEPVRTDQIIPSCLSIIALKAREQGVTVVDACGSSAAWVVWADRALLTQVVLSLLSNAVKFNRQGGTVTVSCQPARAAYLRIAIADTGSGIAAGRQGELFEPFARLGAEATASRGAGLGLAIAKQLTERMKGRIGFQSTEGLGSTFWVELPLAGPPASPASLTA